MVEALLALWTALVQPAPAAAAAPVVDSARAIALCTDEIVRHGGVAEGLRWSISQGNGRASLATSYLEGPVPSDRRMNLQCLVDAGGVIEAVSVEALAF
jgi:hypothetical protein